MFFEPWMMLDLYKITGFQKLFVFYKYAEFCTVKFVSEIFNIAVVLSKVIVLHAQFKEFLIEVHVFP